MVRKLQSSEIFLTHIQFFQGVLCRTLQGHGHWVGTITFFRQNPLLLCTFIVFVSALIVFDFRILISSAASSRFHIPTPDNRPNFNDLILTPGDKVIFSFLANIFKDIPIEQKAIDFNIIFFKTVSLVLNMIWNQIFSFESKGISTPGHLVIISDFRCIQRYF